MEQTSLARLIPGTAPPGYGEDNGDLLVNHIIWGLPADVVPIVAATSQALYRATNGFTDMAGIATKCGPPLISYIDALTAGHKSALYWYWTCPAAGTYMALGYPQTFAASAASPGHYWNDDDELDIKPGETVTAATTLAKHGHLRALQLARTLGCPWDVRVYARAAAHNDLAIMQYAYDNGCPMLHAIGGSIWRIEQALLDSEEGPPIENPIENPIGFWANLDWAWDDETCTTAAANGHLEALQWARAHGRPWGYTTSAAAAAGGHLAALQWAHAQGCPWNEQTTAGAAAGGHLEVLQWARAAKCPWDYTTCSGAAAGGHLEVLQWARAHNCPWDVQTTTGAATGGHLEVLQGARAQDPPCPWELHCSWDENVCNRAAANGHIEVLHWARWNRCRCGPSIYNQAAANGHIEVMKWASTQGWCPIDPGRIWRDASGNLDIMQWLRAQGIGWNYSAEFVYADAVQNDRLDILRWLRAQNCPWPTETFTRLYSSAENHDTTAVLDWLRENGCPEDTTR